MIVDGRDLTGDSPPTADVAIVGSGPAGIVMALEMASKGAEVIMIESGQEGYSKRIQRLADASHFDRDLHAAMSMATRRQVGGASTIWGGRCVPYDPVDFDDRPHVEEAKWPISYDEVLPFFDRACQWLGCGRPVFDALEAGHLNNPIVPGFPNGDVTATSLERWSLPTDFGHEYRKLLAAASNIRLVTGLTCTRLVWRDAGRGIEHAECRSIAGGYVEVRARRYVVAAGGLESTRLLMASPGPEGTAIGNHSGHLGRWYMGHLEGVVSHVHFFTDPKRTVFGYERDVDGVYVRRRFAFTREFQHQQQLPNIVAWLANPELPDASHGSGILSFVYLVLRSPLGKYVAPDAQRLSLTGQRIPGSPYGGTDRDPVVKHLANILRHPIDTARFMTTFGFGRFLAKRRLPGFFVYDASNVYPLEYHGEHRPQPESRVTLSDECDAVGMPKLRIDIRFSDEDVQGVVEAHRHWDEYLRRVGCGHLEYIEDDVEGAVRNLSGGGFHQTGTTRMAARAADGVVDENLAVHGFDDVYVVSSSTFPSSGQANSTFMIVAMAVRLADHLTALKQEETGDGSHEPAGSRHLDRRPGRGG